MFSKLRQDLELLSLGSYFAQVLEAVSPEICELMTEALLHRVVRPYLSASLHWMRLENDRRLVSNWTPWCTLNCLLVLFTLAALPGNVLWQEELRAALQKAAVGMDNYFDATGEDGCCTEGVRYYRHGALSFFAAAELLFCFFLGLCIKHIV